MPYYVYRIDAFGGLERVDGFDAYRDARQCVRSLREGGETMVRMVFAGDAGEAERLLTEKREPRPLGEE